jgi:hypothetical protein
MADLNDRLQKVTDKIAKASYLLSGEEKKREIADILQ